MPLFCTLCAYALSLTSQPEEVVNIFEQHIAHSSVAPSALQCSSLSQSSARLFHATRSIERTKRTETYILLHNNHPRKQRLKLQDNERKRNNDRLALHALPIKCSTRTARTAHTDTYYFWIPIVIRNLTTACSERDPNRHRNSQLSAGYCHFGWLVGWW